MTRTIRNSKCLSGQRVGAISPVFSLCWSNRIRLQLQVAFHILPRKESTKTWGENWTESSEVSGLGQCLSKILWMNFYPSVTAALCLRCQRTSFGTCHQQETRRCRPNWYSDLILTLQRMILRKESGGGGQNRGTVSRTADG